MPRRLPRRLPHARPPRRATGVTVGGSRLADVVPYTGPVMCRNIRPLHNFAPPATPEEVRAAALQYVRKVAGASKPSRANEAAFLRAVDEVADATARWRRPRPERAPRNGSPQPPPRRPDRRDRLIGIRTSIPPARALDSDRPPCASSPPWRDHQATAGHAGVIQANFSRFVMAFMDYLLPFRKYRARQGSSMTFRACIVMRRTGIV